MAAPFPHRGHGEGTNGAAAAATSVGVQLCPRQTLLRLYDLRVTEERQKPSLLTCVECLVPDVCTQGWMNLG
jgi:hypothetical protein